MATDIFNWKLDEYFVVYKYRRALTRKTMPCSTTFDVQKSESHTRGVGVLVRKNNVFLVLVHTLGFGHSNFQAPSRAKVGNYYGKVKEYRPSHAGRGRITSLMHK